MGRTSKKIRCEERWPFSSCICGFVWSHRAELLLSEGEIEIEENHRDAALKP